MEDVRRFTDLNKAYLRTVIKRKKGGFKAIFPVPAGSDLTREVPMHEVQERGNPRHLWRIAGKDTTRERATSQG